jgi:hypothetical protein
VIEVESTRGPAVIMQNYVHADGGSCIFLGWESEVGSPISRNRFAIAQIRLRFPLQTGLLSWLKQFGGHRTNGMGVFLVNSDLVWNMKTTKDNGSRGFLRRDEFRKSSL